MVGEARTTTSATISFDELSAKHPRAGVPVGDTLDGVEVALVRVAVTST